MRTLIVVGHPNYDDSIANKTIIEQIEKKGISAIRNLIYEYPNYKIDIDKEQEYLQNAELIIFQFPIFWASMPAILKLWIDEVFEEDFAYGNNYKLEGKKLLVSTTLSRADSIESINNVENYILFPFKGIANFCKMEYLKPVILYNINQSVLNKATIITKSKEHSNILISKIKKYENFK